MKTKTCEITLTDNTGTITGRITYDGATLAPYAHAYNQYIEVTDNPTPEPHSRASYRLVLALPTDDDTLAALYVQTRHDTVA